MGSYDEEKRKGVATCKIEVQVLGIWDGLPGFTSWPFPLLAVWSQLCLSLLFWQKELTVIALQGIRRINMKMLSTLAEHSVKALSVLVQKIGTADPVTPQICVENRLTAGWPAGDAPNITWVTGPCISGANLFFSSRRVTSLRMSGIFGNSSITELFGFLMIKAYIFYVYHSPLSQSVELYRWHLDAGRRGGVGPLAVTRSHTAPEPCTAPVYTLLLACTFILTQFSPACLLTLQSSPCGSEISAGPHAHKPWVFLIWSGLSFVPWIGIHQRPSNPHHLQCGSRRISAPEVILHQRWAGATGWGFLPSPTLPLFWLFSQVVHKFPAAALGETAIKTRLFVYSLPWLVRTIASWGSLSLLLTLQPPDNGHLCMSQYRFSFLSS